MTENRQLRTALPKWGLAGSHRDANFGGGSRLASGLLDSIDGSFDHREVGPRAVVGRILEADPHMPAHHDDFGNQWQDIDTKPGEHPWRSGRDLVEKPDVGFERPGFGREAEGEGGGHHESIHGGWSARVASMEHRAVPDKAGLIAGEGGMEVMLFGEAHQVIDETGRVGIDTAVVAVRGRFAGFGAPEVDRAGVDEAPFDKAAAGELEDRGVSAI